MQNSPVVISLGGSLIVPDEIDSVFLKNFKNVIIKKIEQGFKFIIIAGGGKISRKYVDAARQVTDITKDDQDWLGIHTTRLNAHLIRTIFRDYSYPVITDNPNTPEKIEDYLLNNSLMVAAGYRPGNSTDYIATLLAVRFNCNLIINLSNIDYAYDKDPNKNSDAKKLVNINWSDFIKVVGNVWEPGLNTPFDPVASKVSKENKLKVIIANGRDFENLENILANKPYKGTTIQD
ncbi:UMP kinase [candidate division WWE3 bacterium CG10_big_fil_rev_8_21_14_0_10_32_10]|uniref:Uridylate kinase n=1 Tax=candidate division WWE3 bacterium CG10_big_fil_rev_8_21_14_0_10_32_10 TaxID=1975090 RepID=A0A2H0RAA5_UNCKA|nr:MAG: UMP kinase [candidate division WWE3 bacterium CG10_big_fil_rev_8_21_14_0_10_32_10]